MKNDRNPNLYSIIFLLVFVAPQAIYSLLPSQFNSTFYFMLVISYIICALYLASSFNNFINPLLFALTFIITGTINLIVHQSSATFNILGPIVAYLGYCFFFTHKINSKVFGYFLIFLYVYYYFIYYSNLPNLFFRPFFDEDTPFFDNSSSNTISISLNIILFAFLVFNKALDAREGKKIFYFSIINLFLILIQQSRAGIFGALILFIIALHEYSKVWEYIKLNKLKVVTILILIILGVSYLFYSNYPMEIETYLELYNEVPSDENMTKEVRLEAQSNFFNDLDIFSFIFGYYKKIYGYEVASDVTYTFNVFLEMWNRYGLLQVIIFFSILSYRFSKRKNYRIPFFYFFPFLFYSMFEAIFLPSFWDVIIYTLIFSPKRLDKQALD